MLKIPINDPKPDFDRLTKILKGSLIAEKVWPAEIIIDDEVKKFILENYFNEKYYPRVLMFNRENKGVLNKLDFEDKKKGFNNYYKQTINFYYKMGYSFLVIDEFFENFESLNTGTIAAKDTAGLSNGDRKWAQEGAGVIKSWKDFEIFPWEKTRSMLSWSEYYINFLSKNLPDGMKIVISGNLIADILNWILGFEGSFYIMYDQPDLFEAMLNKIGQITIEMFLIAAKNDGVGAILIGDDLGFKTSTMISREHLRKWVFPWYKKYASLAHKYKKDFWFHSCGYKDNIMEDLIEDTKIDALHSFEDQCCPVINYKKKYGSRIGIIGGVDVDKLCRLNEESLRKYIRNILNVCMEDGRYALGSGNSITNYIPIKNYLIMLEEGFNWRLK